MIEYVYGAILASILGFFFVFGSFRTKKQSSTNVANGIISDECVTMSSVNEECRSDKGDDTDIIVVGAGVSGFALAYTLGKL